MQTGHDATQNAIVKFAEVAQAVEEIQKGRHAPAYFDGKFFTMIDGLTYNLHTQIAEFWSRLFFATKFGPGVSVS